jgi:DNA anti-recombination protein RmuC
MKTIGVSDTAHTKLKRYCENNDINQGEFVESALKYFEKNGVHPINHESPAAEMTKIIKRIDQIFAFIKKQEIDLVRPMTESVNMSERRIQQDLSVLSRAEQITHLIAALNKLVSEFNNHIKRLDTEFMKQLKEQNEQHKQQHEQNKTAFTLLAKLMDAKNQTGVLQNLGAVYEKLKG